MPNGAIKPLLVEEMEVSIPKLGTFALNRQNLGRLLSPFILRSTRALPCSKGRPAHWLSIFRFTKRFGTRRRVVFREGA